MATSFSAQTAKKLVRKHTPTNSERPLWVGVALATSFSSQTAKKLVRKRTPTNSDTALRVGVALATSFSSQTAQKLVRKRTPTNGGARWLDRMRVCGQSRALIVWRVRP